MSPSVMLRRAATKLRVAKLILNDLYDEEYMYLEEACQQLSAAARYLMYEACDRYGCSRSDDASVSSLFRLVKNQIRSFLMYKDLEENAVEFDAWSDCYFTGHASDPATVIHMYNVLYNLANYLDMQFYG